MTTSGSWPTPLRDRQPVLVGVGTTDVDAEAAVGMRLALEAAAADAGAPGLLSRIDRVVVPRGLWGYQDPGRLIAEAVGSPGARTTVVELGVTQQGIIDEALLTLATGKAEVVAVVGGEARRWARGSDPSGAPRAETAQTGQPDEIVRPDRELFDAAERAVDLVQPAQQYAMIDNALRAAEHMTPDAHRRAIAELWARFNAVALDNPRAAFGRPMTAQEIAEPSAGNRPIAFPYNRWHVSQWTVDQAGALLLCTAAAARAAGVPAERWIYPLVGVHTSRTTTLVSRPELHRWPQMAHLGRAAAEHIGRPLGEIELVDLYSCFPAAVRVQQRELGLPVEGTPTVTGGMAFAGGPLNNYVFQSTAEMVRRLRRAPGALGLVTAVSGFLTKPGLAVWSTAAPAEPPLLGDLEVDAAPAPRAVVLEHRGPATVVSYTVTYEAAEPSRLVVVAETPDGRRCAAHCLDPEAAQAATRTELIGQPVGVDGRQLRL